GAFPSSSRRGGAKRRGGGVQRRRTSCPRHRRVLPSFTGGQRPEHSPPRRGGVARSDGVVGFNAAGPPVRDTVASCPPSQEGKDRSIPLLIEEGWREATGWWGSTPQDHLSATLSRPALLDRRAKTGAFPSSSRRGGAKRRGGGVQRRRTTPPRHCRVLPSLTGGQRPEHSPPRRGGVARSDGVVQLQNNSVTECRTSPTRPPTSVPLMRMYCRSLPISSSIFCVTSRVSHPRTTSVISAETWWRWRTTVRSTICRIQPSSFACSTVSSARPLPSLSTISRIWPRMTESSAATSARIHSRMSSHTSS